MKIFILITISLLILYLKTQSNNIIESFEFEPPSPDICYSTQMCLLPGLDAIWTKEGLGGRRRELGSTSWKPPREYTWFM